MAVICSECPKELTSLQVRRGNVTCGRTCGAARHRRVGCRLAQHRKRREAVVEALRVHATGDMVPIAAAADVTMKFDGDAWLRGYDARLHQERRAS